MGVVGLLLWFSKQKKPAPVPPPPVTSTSASASPPAPTFTSLPFVYDCSKFGVEPAKLCESLPPAEQKLLEAARSFGVTGAGCAYTLGAPRRAQAQAALRVVGSAARVAASASWRRALLQNAVLRIEACSKPSGEKLDAPLALGDKHRAGPAAWRLTAEELAALPSADEQLRPWLGDPQSWLRAERPVSRFHELSVGHTFSFQAVGRGDDSAYIARAVLLDAENHVRVSSLVTRVLLRRATANDIYFCFGEIDASSQSCGAARALQPIGEAEASRLLAEAVGPGCPNCHRNGVRNSGVFGPELGVALDAAAQPRAASRLAALLGW